MLGFKKLQAGRDADPLKKPDPPHPPPALQADCHILYKQDWRLVVAKDDNIDLFGGRPDAPGAGRAGAATQSRDTGYDQLKIYDLSNRLQGLSKDQGIVRDLVCASAEWGSIYALCQDPKEDKYCGY
eukprot:gene10689-1079_t